MTRRSGPTQGREPRSFVEDGDWPNATLEADAPPAASYAQHIASRLAAALDGVSVADVAAEAGLARSTLYDVLAGVTWPDIVTLAELERVLHTRFWPDSPPTRLTSRRR